MKRIALTAVLFLMPYFLFAQYQYVTPAEEEVRRSVAEWQDLKFGMFIHWGAYSQWGVVESWSICPEDYDWQWGPRKGMPYFDYVQKYEHLKDTFNPVNFDPDKWAAAAEYAGMKYVVFTTKHHDGFCMFDTKQTDYKVTDEGCAFHSDPRANIAKTLFDAYRAHGLKAGAYFSIPDWHSDDYWWKLYPPFDRFMNYDLGRYPEKWARYQDYIAAQMGELTSGEYGEISLMWFDMPISDSEYEYPYDWKRFASVVRASNPGMIMVARGKANEYENYSTPEQKIPEKALPYPWESCITMTNGWSYRFEPVYKSLHEMLSMLVKIVSRGGNLLLNVGPAPDGTLDEEAYDRLRGIGDWMKVNSEGIYGTTAVEPYQKDNVYFTSKDGCVYAFYLPEEEDGVLPEKVNIGDFVPASARGVSLLGSGKPLRWTKTSEGVVVTVPESLRRNLPCGDIWCFKIKMK